MKKESLDSKEKIESLLVENQNLHEKLKQVEQEQAVKQGGLIPRLLCIG